MATHVDAVPDNVTFSFIKLQRLGVGFDELCGGRPASGGHERTMRRLVRELGVTALPLLLRKLAARDDGAVSWAYALLQQLSEEQSPCRERVIGELRALGDSAAVDPSVRTKASGLLADVGAGAPAVEAVAPDPSALRDNSLRELARCLDSAAEVARAADLLVVQLDDDALLSFIDDFAASEARRAAALIDELLVRDDVDERTRSELRRLRAPLRERHRSGRAVSRPTVRLGKHEDGRVVVTASVRRTGSKPVRYRSLWAVVDVHGTLVDAGYCSELTGGAVERDMLQPMREEGFAIERSQVRVGRARLIAAARATIAAGGQLPNDFYLGRDMLGLRGEHWVHGYDASGDLTVLLARAIDLLSVGEYARAKPLFERYVAKLPDDAEGAANLGVCLMAMGETAAACEHLERATCLDPGEALNHWNLAAAAHRAGRRGRCYLALLDYVAHTDPSADGDARAGSAHTFIAEYERLARLEHPHQDPKSTARGDQ